MGGCGLPWPARAGPGSGILDLLQGSWPPRKRVPHLPHSGGTRSFHTVTSTGIIANKVDKILVLTEATV